MAELKRKKVMIAVDDSEESTYALRWALDHVVQPVDEVVLFHAQPVSQFLAGPAGPGAFYVTPDVMVSMQKHQEQTSSAILENAKKICGEREIKAKTLVKVGDPRDSICEVTENQHADLLVLGSHGYGLIKRALLGSVSDYCVHNAKCPVLIVKRIGT